MNSADKKSPQARGPSQPLNRRTGNASPLKVAQRERATPPNLKWPIAPPVYKPQWQPKVVQAKTVASAKAAASVQSIKRPIAPPVYRLQQVPKVLQTKSATAQSLPSVQAPRRPVAPPVYRPEAKKLLQPNAILQLRKSPTAPPVYRPEQKRAVQAKMASTAHAHVLPKAPPVYRPRLTQVGVHATMAGSLLLKKPPVAPPIYRSSQPVMQAYGTLNIPEDPGQDLTLSSEDTVLSASPEDFVIVARIITPTQRMPKSKDVKPGLFVSLSKMIVGKDSDASAEAPKDDIVAHYVSQHRDVAGVTDLIEFTSNPTKVEGFARESNLSYTVLVRIKKKYLTSSKSAEGGWMAKQDAPYEIVAGRKDDIHAEKKDERMSRGDIEKARQEELDAEFIERYQGKEGLMAEEFARDPEKRHRYKEIMVKYFKASKTEST